MSVLPIFYETPPGGECDRPFVSTETTLEARGRDVSDVTAATEETFHDGV